MDFGDHIAGVGASVGTERSTGRRRAIVANEDRETADVVTRTDRISSREP